MPCFHPVSIIPPGRSVTPVPCGQCIGCRLERSRQFAVRIVNELQVNPYGAFITLTYDNFSHSKLYNESLDKRDFQLFMKRYRKANSAEKLRYLACGEYGDDNGRPHYHIALLGHRFTDLLYHSRAKSGAKQYVSKSLTECWGNGFCTVSELTYDSARYVASYLVKYDDHYVDDREPEFGLMSRRPGLGSDYIDKYQTEVYNYDKVTMRGGFVTRPPRYYDNKLKKINPVLLEEKKRARNEMLKELELDDWETIRRRELTERRKRYRKERSYENGSLLQ